MSDALSFEKVYTFADLERWEELRPGLPPSLAVLGHPVVHSVSPNMHNAALDYLRGSSPDLAKKLADWKYFKFDIEPGELARALPLLRAQNFKGVNLTLPHKETSINLVKHLSADAKPIGAINTLVPMMDGWHGFNTDGYGLTQSLRLELEFEINGRVVVLLGAGGAAHAAAIASLSGGCAVLWIGNRSQDNLQRFLDHLSSLGPNQPGRIRGFDLFNPPMKEWPDDALIINATKLGLKSSDPLPIKVDLLPKNARVFDMTFQRGGTTIFVSAARDRGLRATDGLSMLVWQGHSALTIWLSNSLAVQIGPEQIPQIMMNAACQALGLPPRHVS